MKGVKYKVKMVCFCFLFILILCFQVNYSSEAKVSDKNIPVYDLCKEKHCLEVRVKEKAYISCEYNNMSHDILTNINPEVNNAEEVLVKYFMYINNKQFNEISQLYYSSNEKNNAIKIAKHLATDFNSVKQIKFIKKWYFNKYEVVVVELIKLNGKTNIMCFSFKKINNKYYRADDWSKDSYILSLFSYMTVNYKKNLVKNHKSRAFEYSITLGEETKNPITIFFDGYLYDYVREWMLLSEETKNNNEVTSYIHNVLIEIPDLNNREFLNLWHGKDKMKMQKLLNKNPDAFISIKRWHTSWDEIKDIFTLNMGELYLHYFLDKTKPSRIRTICIRRVGNEYYLSDAIYSNIKNFLNSELFINKLMNIWKRQANKVSQ